jgi:hypothetical protein
VAYELDVGSVRAEIESLPREAVMALAEVLDLLEVAPWSGHPPWTGTPMARSGR